MDSDAVTIEQEVLRWPGVTSASGRFGAVAFRYEKRESGHIHRDRIADLPVTLEMHEDLLKGATPTRCGRARRSTLATPYGIKKTSRRLSRSSIGTTTAQNPPPVARFVVEAGKRRR